MRWPFEEVLLIRHGETEWNLLGRRQGQLDSALSDNGRRQVDVLATLVVGTGADAVFSSPLGRARATARPIAAELGLPVHVLAHLSEVHHGHLAGLTSEDIEARWPGMLAQRERRKFDWRFPGGESYRDASERVALALEEIAASSPRRPVVVAHEMIGRMIIGKLLELSPADALTWTLSHGTILRIDPNERLTELLTPG